MAFCNNCGNQLKGSERFCAQCGADVSAKAAAASTPSATPAPPPITPPAPAPAAAPIGSFAAAAPPPPVHPGAPVVYPQGGPIPVAYVPPQAAAAQNKNGILGTVFIVVIAAAIGYYFYNKSHTTTNPPTATQPPASQPGAPTNSPPPPSTGGNGGNTALVQQQQLDAQWQGSAGFIMVTAKWTNSSTVNLATAVMECDQYDANGTDLSQFRVTLNGPTPANTWSSYSNVKMGAVANGMTKLACRIAHVTPTS